jgi:hypothetical protein
MKSRPLPSTTTAEAAQLHPFPGGSDYGVANSIALLIEENEKLRRLAALLTSQLEVMRGSTKEEAQPTSMRRVSARR